MCGNGIRCVAQFLVHLENKLEVKEPVGYTIFTKAGRIVTEVRSNTRNGFTLFDV